MDNLTSLQAKLDKEVTSAAAFRKQLEQIAIVFLMEFEQYVGEVCNDLFLELVGKTPVDTGFARMNWKLTNDEPPIDDLPRPEDWESIEADTVYDIKYSEAMMFKIKIANGVVYIYNNCEYLDAIENTHRTAHGFISTTVRKFRYLVEQRLEASEEVE